MGCGASQQQEFAITNTINQDNQNIAQSHSGRYGRKGNSGSHSKNKGSGVATPVSRQSAPYDAYQFDSHETILITK